MGGFLETRLAKIPVSAIIFAGHGYLGAALIEIRFYTHNTPSLSILTRQKQPGDSKTLDDKQCQHQAAGKCHQCTGNVQQSAVAEPGDEKIVANKNFQGYSPRPAKKKIRLCFPQSLQNKGPESDPRKGHGIFIDGNNQP
jgi:hypothetical protein